MWRTHSGWLVESGLVVEGTVIHEDVMSLKKQPGQVFLDPKQNPPLPPHVH